MPVSTLTCTLCTPPIRAAAATAARAPSRDPIVRVRSWLSASPSASAGASARRRIGAVMPDLAKFDALVDDGDREEVGPADECRFRRQFGAVTVGVGLHDGTDQ